MEIQLSRRREQLHWNLCHSSLRIVARISRRDKLSRPLIRFLFLPSIYNRIPSFRFLSIGRVAPLHSCKFVKRQINNLNTRMIRVDFL